jgi:hypothetical protein
MTKRINGGTIGLEDRKKHYEHALEVLGGHYTPTVTYETVRLGSRGDTVKKLQEALHLSADGIFGSGTEKALKEWQSKNICDPVGLAGPQTLGTIFGA